MSRSTFRAWTATSLGTLLAAALLVACASPTHTAKGPSPQPTSTPNEIYGVTGNWMFDGPLQLFVVEARALPYAPGNYHLKPGNQLYQVLMEARDLYEHRNLILSGHFELKENSRILDTTTFLRGFVGNKILGKTLLVKPFKPVQFSVLFQFKKGEKPTTFRAVFTGERVRPVAVRVKP